MQGINDLGFPTINGLKSLNLDELETTVLNANTIDGNIIYYNRIEGNEIIVDTKLTLTNTGVIAVGDKFISDIELTYLDGVNDNIQKQIDNIAGQDLQFQAQIDNHTNQINDLQISDTEQNTLLENLEATVNTYDFRIETLEINDVTQANQITALQTSDTAQNTAITTLQAKTQYISSTAFATTMSRPLYITGTDVLRFYGNHSYFSGWSNVTNNRDWVIGTPNNGIKQFWIANEKQDGIYLRTGSRAGNTNLGQNKIITNSNGISLRRGGITAGDTEVTVGEIGALSDGNLRINGTSTNNIILSSGLGEINCESNLLRVGATTANANGRKSNILMYNSTGDNWETQSSAFTETLKSQIGTNTSNITILQTSNASLNSSISALQTSDTAQNTNITNLQTKTQNISSANSTSTVMSKPLHILADGECLKTMGNPTFWGGYDSTGINRHFKIGKENSTSNNLLIQNYILGEVVIQSGPRTGNPNFGQNKIITHSNGISLRRGGTTDTLVTVGEIGAISDTNFRINGSSNNNIIIDSALGQISTYSNAINIFRGNLLRPLIGTIGNNTGSPTDTTFYIQGDGINNIAILPNAGQLIMNGSACTLDFNDFQFGKGTETGNINISTRNQNLVFDQDLRLVNLLDAGLFLSSNNVWIGKGDRANPNGRKSNINMLASNGTTWETQSSAFTEELKARLLRSTTFGNNTGKIEFIAASFWWLGFAYNLTTLIASRTYNVQDEDFYYGAEVAVGGWLNSFGYPNMFDATGAYLLNDKPNLTLIFEMEFTAAFSLVTYIYSKVVVKNNAGTVLSETLEQGTYYNGLPEENKRHYKYFYSTAPLRHILNQGDRIFVNTKYSFLTPNSISIDGVKMKGKFSMHAN